MRPSEPLPLLTAHKGERRDLSTFELRVMVRESATSVLPDTLRPRREQRLPHQIEVRQRKCGIRPGGVLREAPIPNLRSGTSA